MADEFLDGPDRDYDLDSVLNEFRKDGTLLRAKSRIIFEEAFLPRAFKVLQNEATPVSQVVDVANVLLQSGDLKPKQSTPPSPGPMANITFVFPSMAGETPRVVQGELLYPTDPDGTDPTPELPAPEVNYNTPALDFNLEVAPQEEASGE